MPHRVSRKQAAEAKDWPISRLADGNLSRQDHHPMVLKPQRKFEVEALVSSSTLSVCHQSPDHRSSDENAFAMEARM
jgi:hypothetical protein